MHFSLVLTVAEELGMAFTEDNTTDWYALHQLN